MRQAALTRRGLVRALGAGAAAAVLGRGTTGRARGTDGDWRHYRHDARNSGNATGHDVPAVGLVEDWRFDAEGQVFAPTVADGTVYVPGEVGVHALDAASGEEVWSAPVGRVFGSPTVVNGMVFAATGTGTVHALDAGSGEARWQFEPERERGFPPAVVNDRLYAGSGNRIYALSPIDGSERWRFETGGRVGMTPAVVDGTLYVGDYGGTMYAVDAAEGTREWRTQLPEPAVSPPAVADGTVYVGGGEGGVFAVSAADGSLRWRVEAEEFVAGPAVGTDTVYVKSQRVIRALSTADGSERWRREVGGAWSSPVLVGDTVFVGGERRLYSLAADDGTVRDSFEARTRAIHSPVAVDGSVYVSGRRGRLYALSGGVKAVISGLDHVSWGNSSTFSAAKSVTSADSIERYEWVVDGLVQSRDTGPRTTHTFWGPGPVDIVLRVTDSQGRTARTRETVYVQNSITFWMLSGAAGLTGVGTLGAVGARRLRGGGSGAEGPPDTATSASESATPEADEDAFETHVDAAEEAVAEAERHRSQANHDAAVAAYDEAVQQYFAALNQLPEDDDRRDDLRATREDVESARASLDEQRETHAELVEALGTAESHFQTAVAAPTSDRVVIPRERYRQARDAYDRALDRYDELENPPETLTVSPDVDIAAPPSNLTRFPGVTPAATERLEELGVDTLSALRDADEGTVEELRSAAEIHDKLAVRLVGLHYWLDGDDLVLSGREDLERRKELAAEGYRVHR